MKFAMSAPEIRRYRSQQKPSGIGGPAEWLELQRWYYAQIWSEIDEIERGTFVVTIAGESLEDAKTIALAQRRVVLQSILDSYLSSPD